MEARILSGAVRLGRLFLMAAIVLVGVPDAEAAKRRAVGPPFSFVASPRMVPIAGGTDVVLYGRGYVAGQTSVRVDGAPVDVTILSHGPRPDRTIVCSVLADR